MKRIPHYSPDVVEFLFLLDKFNVRYLVVGGEAVIYYGHARLTGDIDIYYESSSENAECVFQTLKKFWNGSIPGSISTEELQRPGMVFQFGIPPNRIDLLNSIEGIGFHDAWRRKEIQKTNFRKKLFQIYYIGIADLIKNKKCVNRDKDRDDLKYLKAALKKRNHHF